jgi:hypothetical protein
LDHQERQGIGGLLDRYFLKKIALNVINAGYPVPKVQYVWMHMENSPILITYTVKVVVYVFMFVLEERERRPWR